MTKMSIEHDIFIKKILNLPPQTLALPLPIMLCVA
jgi:hypothetical protein